MADYDWFDRKYIPTEAERQAVFWRAQGLIAKFRNDRFGTSRTEIDYYICRRGCGCLVWDPQQHINNVCTEFNPVAGE